MERPPVLVLGVGHPDRGDDAVGPLMAVRLEGRYDPAQVEVLAHQGEGLGLMALWEGRALVVLIDAARSGAGAGSLHQLDSADGSLFHPMASKVFGLNSHAFGVHEAVLTAQAIGRLPTRLRVLALEGADFDLGAAPTPRVQQMLATLETAIVHCIDDFLGSAA